MWNPRPLSCCAVLLSCSEVIFATGSIGKPKSTNLRAKKKSQAQVDKLSHTMYKSNCVHIYAARPVLSNKISMAESVSALEWLPGWCHPWLIDKNSTDCLTFDFAVTAIKELLTILHCPTGYKLDVPCRMMGLNRAIRDSFLLHSRKTQIFSWEASSTSPNPQAIVQRICANSSLKKIAAMHAIKAPKDICSTGSPKTATCTTFEAIHKIPINLLLESCNFQ